MILSFVKLYFYILRSKLKHSVSLLFYAKQISFISYGFCITSGLWINSYIF